MASARTRADARAAALSWSARCDGRRTIAAPSTGAGWSMYLSVANASPNARQFAAAMSRDNHVLRLCGCISTEDNVGPEWTGLMPVLWERRKDRGPVGTRHPGVSPLVLFGLAFRVSCSQAQLMRSFLICLHYRRLDIIRMGRMIAWSRLLFAHKNFNPSIHHSI